MGRRETPLPKTAPLPLQEFAQDLRDLRAGAALTIAEVEERSGYSKGRLSEAASGRWLPSDDVTRGFVGACGGDRRTQDAWVSRARTLRADPEVAAYTGKPASRDEVGQPSEPPGERPTAKSHRRLLVGSCTVVAALVLAVAAGVLLPDWDRLLGADDEAARTEVRTPDASRAEPDITSDGRPVVLPATMAGRCEAVVEGAGMVEELPYGVDGELIAELWVYYSATESQACAKLVKPDGSPYVGVATHLALTLCGDANSCDHDWNAYAIDAGPVVVPSQDGCTAYRVSMLDESGNDWLVRDDIGWVGCPWT